LPEKAYTDANARALEISKTVSLAQLNPRSLLALKLTGECTFDLSERLFDFDYPGQYCRKLKNVSITLPAVVGPYQTIHATLTQLSNQLVLKPDIEVVKFLLGETTKVPGPEALRSNVWTNQQIALSKGLDDSGLFQLNFDDPRFVPFEGTGAISSWRLSMPPQTNRLNFSTITDVLIQLSYTALDGGAVFRQQVLQQPQLATYVGSPLFSLAQVYSLQWFTFMADHSDPAVQSLSFPVSPGVVPPHVDDAELVGFFVQLITDKSLAAAPDFRMGVAMPYLLFQVSADEKVDFALAQNDAYYHAFKTPIPMEDVFGGDRALSFLLAPTPEKFKLNGYINPAVVKNIALVLYYTATVKWP
jgi:hypothetical protein